MLPSELTAASFANYPEMARSLAVANVGLLREFPLPLAGAVLRELCAYDWLFPAEQNALKSQFQVLSSLDYPRRKAAMSKFAALTVPQSVSDMDWVNHAKQFSEALTVHLWASHQIDAFHVAATDYAAVVDPPVKDADLPLPRTTIVVLPRELENDAYPLFRKLRAHGVFFQNVDAGSRFKEILAWIAQRAAKYNAPFAHVFIDGTDTLPIEQTSVETVSWGAVASLRQDLLRRMRDMMATPGVGPEMVRTRLASFSPADFGIRSRGKDAVIDHFKLSVLSEGSGTQIFSTTFAQWSAREILRRAQPLTLVMRYGCRQQMQAMNEMLSGTAPSGVLDVRGSVIDADMGAYYTWINQQRLPGSDKSAFLAWSESRRQAIAIGPGLPKGTDSPRTIEISSLLSLLS
ncbi:MAG TPA: hypothetical protein VGG85_15175 [Terracidiphilus sp.]